MSFPDAICFRCESESDLPDTRARAVPVVSEEPIDCGLRVELRNRVSFAAPAAHETLVPCVRWWAFFGHGLVCELDSNKAGLNRDNRIPRATQLKLNHVTHG